MGTFGVKRASDEKFCPSTLPRKSNLQSSLKCYTCLIVSYSMSGGEGDIPEYWKCKNNPLLNLLKFCRRLKEISGGRVAPGPTCNNESCLIPWLATVLKISAE